MKKTVKIEETKITIKQDGIEEIYVKTQKIDFRSWISFRGEIWVWQDVSSDEEDEEDVNDWLKIW